MSDISSMQATLLDALDDITSTRSSPSIRSEGLTCLEKLIAIACLSGPSSQSLDLFLALQDTFECNVPSRLISWIGLATHTLECSAARTLSPYPTNVETLAAQVSQALTLIQGVALNHKPSKQYLGRQHSLEILLDLLITSRHVPPPSSQPVLSLSSTSAPSTSPALSSVVLDTLLCILVDSSSALRAFEDTSGVKCVVKILKRAGTPKEVRMKCLEFLYFYLLDENPNPASGIDENESPLLSPVSPSPVPADAYRSMSPPPLVMPTAASSQTKATPDTPQRTLGLGTPGRRGLRKSNTEGQILPLPTPLAISEDRGLASSTSSSRAPSRAESTSSHASSESRNNPTHSQAKHAPTHTSRLHTRTRSEASQSHRTLSFASSTSSASSSSKPSSFSSHRPTSSISSVASTSSSTSSKAPSERRPSFSSHHSPPPLPIHRPSSLSSSSSQATPTGPRATRSGRSNSQSTSTSTSIFASQPNRLVMLRKDVDYVPQSPVKTSHGSQMSHLDAHLLSRRNSDASTTSSTTSSFDGAHHEQHLFSPRKASVNDSTSSHSILSTSIVSSVYSRSGNHRGSGRGRDERKTTEEKKALLGSFLGNVDALVEGVRKAGVWGLS